MGRGQSTQEEELPAIVAGRRGNAGIENPSPEEIWSDASELALAWTDLAEALGADHRASLWRQLESSLTSALIEGDERARGGAGSVAVLDALERIAVSWERRAADMAATIGGGSQVRARESRERLIVLRSAAQRVRALGVRAAA